MFWLVLGVALFSAVHLLPVYASDTRGRLVDRIGEKPFKGVFSLVSVGTFVLIGIGWDAALGSGLAYLPPAWGVHVNNLLMLAAVAIFPAGHAKAFPRRYIRHPQLTAVALWAVAHLLANGEWRSIVLFGGFGLWAVASMIGANMRDGAWERPPPSTKRANVIWAVASLVVFIVLIVVHPWLFGVSPVPMG